MEGKTYSCPTCSAPLTPPPGGGTVKCPYCGRQVVFRARENSGGERFRFTGGGRPIGQAPLPAGWQGAGEIRNVLQSLNRPFTASCEAVSPDGATRFFYNTGESFRQIKRAPVQRHQEGTFDQSAMMPLRAFIPPAPYLDSLAAKLLPGVSLRFMEQGPLPQRSDPSQEREKLRREAEAEYAAAAASGGRLSVDDVFWDGCVRLYAFDDGGRSRVLALSCVLQGVEWSIGGAFGGLGGALGGLGGILGGQSGSQNSSQSGGLGGGLRGLFDLGMSGGLLGRAARGAPPPPAPEPRQEGGGGFGSAPCAGALMASIDWESRGVYGMLCDAPLTSAGYAQFAAFCSGFVLDPSIPAAMQEESQRIVQRMQAQQQSQFNAWQQAHAAQTAAFDAYNKSWWDRTNAADNARRTAYQSRMDAEDRMSRMRSEATRGVNTYERPDGSTFEFSVGADRVFMRENDGSTYRAASYGENVPPGWVEVHRKP